MGDEFQIQIVSDADLKGFQQVSDASTRLKADTSELTDETRRATASLEPAKDAAKNFGGAAEEAGEKVGGSRREMREMGNELGKIGGVADLGKAFMGEFGLAVFAAATALELLKSSWDSVQEGNVGAIKFSMPDDAAKIEAAAKAWSQYAEARKKAIDAMNTPETAAARDVANLQNKLKLLQDILKAEEQEALANLAANKDKMSPQAYADAEANIKSAFAGKEASATSNERQAEIDRKRQEAADLEKRSAEEKAKGEGLSTGNATVQKQAQDNAEGAKESLKQINEQIAMVTRLRNSKTQDVPEYQGGAGLVQKAEDGKDYYMRYGFRVGDEVLKNLELQKTQAEAQISLGAQAKDQQERLSKEKGELLTQAGTDSGNAEKVRREANDAQTQLDAENQNTKVTSALGAAGTALGQEHAAEGNNTPQGYADAQAARGSANKAVAELSSALKGVTDTHSEAYAAIHKAIADLQAEDRKLAAKLSQTNFNNK